MAIADYLNRLLSLRDDLADNLVEKGVEAEHTETLAELVPKVRSIRGEGAVIGDLRENLEAVGAQVAPDAQGNDLVDWVLHIFDNDVGSAGGTFEALLAEKWDTPYDMFTRSETFSPADVLTISSAVRVKSVMVRLVGDGVTTLTHTGPGWAREDVPAPDGGDEQVFFRFTPASGGIIPARQIMAALASLKIGGNIDSFAIGQLYVYVTRYDGVLYRAAGSAWFVYTNIVLWAALQAAMQHNLEITDRAVTWGDAAGMSCEESTDREGNTVLVYDEDSEGSVREPVTWEEAMTMAVPRQAGYLYPYPDEDSALLPGFGGGIVGSETDPYRAALNPLADAI